LTGGSGATVDLPVACFNQYNVAVLRSSTHSARSDFARFIAQKFGRVRFIVVASEPAELKQHFDALRLDATFCTSLSDLVSTLPQNGNNPPADLAIWFYPAEKDHDARAAEEIALRAREVLLVLSDVEIANRRPDLVEQFRRLGLRPDYQCDLGDLESTSLHLIRKSEESSETLVPAVESAIARLNRHVRGLQRTLRTRLSELEAADRHIAKLEEKLLKLKEAKRQVKQLKQEKQALRKSPERKIGQVLLAPYRLPQKLLREVRKRYPKSDKSYRTSIPANEYQQWLANHVLKRDQVPTIRQESQTFAYKPLITIVTPVFNTPVAWLTECVESVLAQAYENWELILVDDDSTDPETTELLRELSARDPRITLAKNEKRAGISVASNRGISLAKGEWVGFLDHDDVLEPDALFCFAKWLQEHPDADLIYSDEDKLTEQGFDAPIFKPDWSPDYFLSCNYVCHFTLVRCDLLRKIGGLKPEFDGAQDYDLFLRIVEETNRIDHIPRILYHWRRSLASTADNIRRKPGSLETGRQVLEAHLARQEQKGHVTVDWPTHTYWIRRQMKEAKKISIIIPVRDQIELLIRCLTSLTSNTHYAPYEIVVVDNDSQSEEARTFFSQFPHRLLRYAGPFNFSAMNNFAVEQTESPWLLFLNNDTEVIERDWLTVMAEHVQRPEVGAVGPMLLYPDDTVQHAGIVMGVGGIAEHAFRGWPADSPGVCRQLQTTRNYSAVTGACLLTRRDVFVEVGGFDEEQLPVTFSDVDLCLKMRRAGYRIIYTPFAKLYHHESSTRRPAVEPMETGVMQERWREVLEQDPYYNPNLSRERADFSLSK
jgi:GT2 family glycosyltransferase